MNGEVVCPSCGRGNERRMAETYRICVHCGGDLTPAMGPGTGTEVRETTMGGPGPRGPPPPGGPQPPPAAPGQPRYPQPPPHGQVPVTQPYGGQPYPPGGVPPPPYHGAPPSPGMYPPTFHPGVYERPEREPRLDLGALLRLLFRPKETFEDLYDHTTATQGIIVAVLLIVLSAAINIAATYAILGSLDIPDTGATVGFFGATTAGMTVFSMVLNIVLFFVTAYLVFWFLRGPGNARRPSRSKTMGMMGYAKFPAFIIMVALAFISPVLMQDLDIDQDRPEDALALAGTLCAVFGVFYVLGFFWSIWVHSHAQSVANDVSLGMAFGFTFLAWFIIFIIMMAVTMMYAFMVLGSVM